MEIYQKLSDWLVPVLIGAAIAQLRSIASEMREISKALAVAITKVDAHEQRIQRLEERQDDARS
jgi:hypothetical protein